jgi:hypothetical protein
MVALSPRHGENHSALRTPPPNAVPTALGLAKVAL